MLSEVCSFLRTAGLMCIFICNYSVIVHPLTHLTCKEIDFEFDPKEIEAQKLLKHAIVTPPAIRALDYKSNIIVYLSVDTSYIAIGYVITQDDPDNLKICRPSHFGSMLLTQGRQSIPNQSSNYTVYFEAYVLHICGL